MKVIIITGHLLFITTIINSNVTIIIYKLKKRRSMVHLISIYYYIW